MAFIRSTRAPRGKEKEVSMRRHRFTVLIPLGFALSTAAGQEEKPAPKAPPTVAHVKISGDLGERNAPEVPFGRPPLTYRGLLEILKKAEADPLVRAVILEVKEPSVGMARLQGIRQALVRLRSGGKKLYVHTEELTQPGMVLASLADRLSIPESGLILLPGVSAEVLYLKNLFALLGIDWLVIQQKEYKSAFESFVRDRMSPELREVLEGMLDQNYQTLVENISSGRRIPAERVREAIDQAIITPQRARELGLVDAVEYRDEFEAAIRKDLGGEITLRQNYGRGSRDLEVGNPFVLFAQLMKVFSPPERRRGDPTPKIAIVYAEGPIMSGKSQGSPFGGAGTVGSVTLVKAIEEAAGDDSVKAIVLRIDSPGGSGTASDVIWRSLMRAREKKPVIASLSDVAASGGYYLAMGAQYIVAEPTTITGSIGVIAARPNLERLLGFWGVRAERIQRGRNAGIFDVFREPSDGERGTLTDYVSGFYREFVGKVARSRGLPEEEVEKVARGRVWTGLQAKERHLVDELGGLELAMEIARKRANLPEDAAPRVIEYPEPPDFFEILSESFEMRTFLGALAQAAQGFSPGGTAPGNNVTAWGSLPGAALASFSAVPELRVMVERLWQLRSLSGEPVLAILPFEVLLR
jgi:protease-4